MSRVENIHHIVNKKVASYTNYTVLMRHQHKCYYWGSQGFVKGGPQTGPKGKMGGAQAFSGFYGCLSPEKVTKLPPTGISNFPPWLG